MNEVKDFHELMERLDEEIEECIERMSEDEGFIPENMPVSLSESRRFDVEALVARIDAKIAELEAEEKKLSAEEEKILELIKETLKNHDLKYVYDPDRPKMVEVGFATKNKPFKVYIILQNEKVILKALLPFRVQCNSLAIVSMYIAEFNKDKAFSLLNLNPDDGEITMEYTFMLNRAEDYDAKEFWIYMISIIQPLLETYTRLYHLSVGKISNDKKDYYKALLEKSLALINGEEEDEDDIIFGSEEINQMRRSTEDLLQELKRRNECRSSVKREDDKEDIHLDFLGGAGNGERRISFFEELLKSRENGNPLGKDEDDEDEVEVEGMASDNNMPFDEV